MNGTGGNDLLEQHLAVSNALRNLHAAMCNAGPNGRDYYVQGDGAFTVAQAEHRLRLLKVDELARDYNTLVENISEQIDNREAIKAGAIRRTP